MPADQSRVGALFAAHFVIIGLFMAPMAAYSSASEDHQKRLASVIIKNTEAILKEIERVKPSPKPDSQGKERVNAIPKDVDKKAVKI